LDKAVK